MDFSPISVGMKPQSGGNYKATAKRYDFYSNDAVYTSDRRYSCCGGRSLAADMGVAFYLKGIKNVSLDFCGATVFLHGKIQPMHSENVVPDGLKMFYDGRSHGFISNGADGVHAVACSGKFVIKNSVIEGTLDDALNIHGNFYKLLSAGKNSLKANTHLRFQNRGKTTK